jgi:transposase
VGSFSNPSDQLERLRTLLELPQPVRPQGSLSTPMQAQRRLDSREVAQLVAAYRSGGRVKRLAAQFGIHRETVRNTLKREGITPRPPGIRPDDLSQAIRLYRQGCSLAELARRFDVSHSTVTNTLRRAGEPSRRASRSVRWTPRWRRHSPTHRGWVCQLTTYPSTEGAWRGSAAFGSVHWGTVMGLGRGRLVPRARSFEAEWVGRSS